VRRYKFKSKAKYARLKKQAAATSSKHSGSYKNDVKGAGLKAAATKSKSLHTFFRERCSGQGYH
jgi:hypothetical protein